MDDQNNSSNCMVNLEEMHFHDHCQACLICYFDQFHTPLLTHVRDPM